MKVLLVEEDEFVREALTEVLQNLDCYVVTTEGEFAYDIFVAEKDVPFDLVITANKFKEASGLELIERISAENKQVIIVLISANSKITNEVALFSGADAFLSKPFNLQDLELIVFQILLKKHTDKTRLRLLA